MNTIPVSVSVSREVRLQELLRMNITVTVEKVDELKKSDKSSSGYWNVTTQKSYNGKWKAMIPGGKGRMIPSEEGGGLFDTPEAAATVLKKYCIKNGLKY